MCRENRESLGSRRVQVSRPGFRARPGGLKVFRRVEGPGLGQPGILIGLIGVYIGFLGFL